MAIKQLGAVTSAADNSTNLATTAYVDTAGNLKAPLASPTFTGTPAAPTATAGTSTTQLATTAFATTANNLKVNLNVGATPFLAGNYYKSPAGTTVSAQAMAATTAIGARVLSGRTCTITTLAINVTSAGSAGSVVRLGVFALSTDASTATLVADFGTTVTTATGIKTATGTAAITAGSAYLLVAASQGAPTTRPTITCCNAVDTWIGFSDAASIITGGISGYGSDATVSGAFPSTLPGFAVVGATVHAVAALCAS